ncbi:hypothetical protein Hamer_G005187 [Homarus americanus]|uniref:Uncharacterized protein n=1 Tax=Homarus americanus TaxID=6706 RepID=A0A8J5K4I3_HOMAM|nr:hypothetical protein Hamer_G005187 [Homarus americanus]
MAQCTSTGGPAGTSPTSTVASPGQHHRSGDEHSPHVVVIAGPIPSPQSNGNLQGVGAGLLYPALPQQAQAAGHPPAPPAAQGKASMGMSPIKFRAWAFSIATYSNRCNWPQALAAGYVLLLCETEVQCIDARVNKCVYDNLMVEEAIRAVESVVVSPKCFVGAWADFFAYTQEPGDNVSRYVVRCR